MKYKHIKAHMKVAHIYAECSSAVRLKVGAIVVKDNRIISIGYNGTPVGWESNECEYKDYMDSDAGGWLDLEEIETRWPFNDDEGRYALKTKPEVMHAERNAIDKLAKGSESSVDSVIFVTHAPCMECAKSIHGAGITALYYTTDYRDTAGIEFLKQCNIEVIKVDV
jgi:dCMP deaminase